MAEVAVDFGTCNTVLARYSETLGRAETLRVGEIGSRLSYRRAPGAPEESVWLIPSVVHYTEKEILIGDQVISRGLAEHPATFRWMKRSVAAKATKTRQTAQGYKSPIDAASDFLRLALTYASNTISLADDSFTFTAPVEAFESFQDWLVQTMESVGVRRWRLLDEPTAAVFGSHGAARKDERFCVFDFGGGTLDVSVVMIDLASATDYKAVQLGQAGMDLGGMNVDLWLAKDFCRRHNLDDFEKRELEALILRQAEEVKIQLSDPAAADVEMTVLDTSGRAPRVLQTVYRRECPLCEPRTAGGAPGDGDGCLGCLLAGQEFIRKASRTVHRALMNAASKAGLQQDDLSLVIATGGATLMPVVRRYLEGEFGKLLHYDNPFDTVVRGACRGIVDPILRHDYALESYDMQRKEYCFEPLFKAGTEYPTPPGREVRVNSQGTRDGMTRIGLKIFEVSQVRKQAAPLGVLDEKGDFRQEVTRVRTDREYICLNEKNPTFIAASPPIALARDGSRFQPEFRVDGNRRLLVTVVDRLTGKTLLADHLVVRL